MASQVQAETRRFGNRHQSGEGEKPKKAVRFSAQHRSERKGEKWHMKNVNLQRKGQRIFQSTDPEKGARREGSQKGFPAYRWSNFWSVIESFIKSAAVQCRE